MPPYRPPSLSPSTSDYDTDVSDQGMNRSSPAAAVEQDSDEEGTGADAPEAVALTDAKRAVCPDTTGAQVAAVEKARIWKGLGSWAPCARGRPPSYSTSVRRAPSMRAAWRDDDLSRPPFSLSSFIRLALSPAFLSSVLCFTSSFFAHDRAFTPPSSSPVIDVRRRIWLLVLRRINTSVATGATIYAIPPSLPLPRNSTHSFLSAQPPARLPQPQRASKQSSAHLRAAFSIRTHPPGFPSLRILLAYVSAEHVHVSVTCSGWVKPNMF
ncbi:hypothetical protein DFH09DRAFT_1322349 [Mycena vulgaris]|nr:hypothetical protein DFH09DRAFT_1322349 [Mycena vulgaris]